MRLFIDGYNNNELTEKKPYVSTTEKFLLESAGSFTRVLQLEHQTLIDWHDISLQPIHGVLEDGKPMDQILIPTQVIYR